MGEKKFPERMCCTYCGTQAPNGALFCPHCGEPINPNYVYNESISIEEAVVEQGENLRVDEIIPTPRQPIVLPTGTQVLYEGMIRGLVTGESDIIETPVLGASKMYVPNPSMFPPMINPYFNFAKAQFVIKLEEDIGIEGVPDEILVQTREAGYFGIGDEVTLQGTIFKINLERWNRPLYVILADHFYNESLQIEDEGLVERKQVLYEGIMGGLVTKESITRFDNQRGLEVYFVMKLEFFEGVTDEILVRSIKSGYFRVGDKVIIKGKIVKEDLKQWNRPLYVILADYFYNESLQIGDERLMERKQVLYEGMIRGLVTGESTLWRVSLPSDYPIFFVMKLDERSGIEGVPDEILVKTKIGYFSKGDEVILQGKIVKKDLKELGRPMYVIHGDHYYNESLQVGDRGSEAGVQVLQSGIQALYEGMIYEGMIRGSVTRESITMVKGWRTYFAMKLEENIGIRGIPEEILVHSGQRGYFRIGDKVILKGRIFKINLERRGRPMYVIEADYFYNESLQIGD